MLRDSYIERGWMPVNATLGVKKGYKPDKNANRAWRREEWEVVMARSAAPSHCLQ
jgi:hypothetical protein